MNSFCCWCCLMSFKARHALLKGKIIANVCVWERKRGGDNTSVILSIKGLRTPKTVFCCVLAKWNTQYLAFIIYSVYSVVLLTAKPRYLLLLHRGKEKSNTVTALARISPANYKNLYLLFFLLCANWVSETESCETFCLPGNFWYSISATYAQLK